MVDRALASLLPPELAKGDPRELGIDLWRMGFKAGTKLAKWVGEWEYGWSVGLSQGYEKGFKDGVYSECHEGCTCWWCNYDEPPQKKMKFGSQTSPKFFCRLSRKESLTTGATWTSYMGDEDMNLEVQYRKLWHLPKDLGDEDEKLRTVPLWAEWSPGYFAFFKSQEELRAQDHEIFPVVAMQVTPASGWSPDGVERPIARVVGGYPYLSP